MSQVEDQFVDAVDVIEVEEDVEMQEEKVASPSGVEEVVGGEEAAGEIVQEQAGEEAEGEEEEAKEEAKVEETPVEVSKDEVFEEDEDLIQDMKLNDFDCTFNVQSGNNNRSMFSIRSDGFDMLLGGMRANYGFKSGRYYLETKMIDQPKSVRMGFSILKSNCLLDDTDAFCFESHGDVYIGGVKKVGANPRWSRTDVVGVLLDINEKTISLFINGTLTPTGSCISLPDHLFAEDGTTLKDGYELFPHIASKGTAVECNFSNTCWKKLEYKVRMIGQGKKCDTVETSKKQIDTWTKEDLQADLVEVFVPVGFDCRDMIKQWEKENPNAIVLTGEHLALWGEKSGLSKRPLQTGGRTQDRWGINCLDSPMNVFPILLKGRRKYILCCSNLHNLHPASRADQFAKLRHALNVKFTGLVAVDDIEGCVEGTRPIPPPIRDNYEGLKMPDMENEGFDTVQYYYRDPSSKQEGEKTQAELKEIVDTKFLAWKKNCKLKSKVTDLKKSSFYKDTMQKFLDLQRFMHKRTSVNARAQWQRDQDAKKAARQAKKEAAEKEKAAKKESGEEAEKAAEKGEGEDSAEKEKAVEEEKKEENEEEDDPEPPQAMTEFSEEDWMLATLRAEMHAVMWAFKNDVNDEERLSFASIHFPYYYQLYTGKSFATTLNNFACKTLEEITRLVPEICKHTACMDEFALRKEKNQLIEEYDLIFPALPIDTDMLKLIEMTDECRQNRTDRLDAGDENAALHFHWKPSVGTRNNRDNQSAGGNQVQYSNKRPQQSGQDYEAAKRRAGYSNRR